MPLGRAHECSALPDGGQAFSGISGHAAADIRTSLMRRESDAVGYRLALQVPFWQYKIIEGCRKRGKPVITATNSESWACLCLVCFPACMDPAHRILLIGTLSRALH